MKRWIPLIIAVLSALWVASKFRLPAPDKDKHGQANRLAALPVIWEGRMQPLDSVARNALIQLRGKQTLNLEPWKGNLDRPETIPASAWLMDVFFDPEKADTYPCFRIDNEGVKGLLGLPLNANEAEKLDGKHYTWNQIAPHVFDLLSEATRASRVEKDLRDAYEKAVMDTWEAVSLYRQLKAAIGPAGSRDEFPTALRNWRVKFEEARIAFDARQRGEPANDKALDWLNEQMNTPLLLQPQTPEGEWQRIAMHLRNLPEGQEPHPQLAVLHKVGRAYVAKDEPALAAAVTEAHAWSDSHPVYLHADDREDGDAPRSPLAHALSEQRFNTAQPFYLGMVLSVLAFLLLIVSWFNAQKLEGMRRTGTALLWVVFAILTYGICWRMFHEERPPVTNLYSSALLIGWGVLLAGLLLEKIYPRAIGAVVAAMATFGSLLVAHFLALSGDTMVMLQAVLDTTFWLATHVVIVTLGYAGTFVAGFFGLIYVVLTYLDRKEDHSKMLGAMAFGVVCFSVLFSFVGTVLGGLWADQSWGRFWGWDPKENGALLIVLWNALILHARLGGMVKQHGFLKLCILGNIVTAWSWFGTNMLGIGLHSYGFMGAAYYALIAFAVFNLVVSLLGRKPGPRKADAAAEPPAAGVPAQPA